MGTRPENLSAAVAVMSAELERCVADPAAPDELVRSRENLKGRVVLSLESTAARMSHLGTSVLNGTRILSVDEVIARIDAVGLSDLQELASDLFQAQRLSIACVGPDEERFLKAIQPLGASARRGRPRQLARSGAAARKR